MKKYAVKEIFGPTIQGEGSHAGRVVIFLRFAGCNRWDGLEESKGGSICSFCDTDFVGGEKLTAIEIVDEIASKSLMCKTVVISGGEPLLQLDQGLMTELLMRDYKVHLETNGSKSMGNMKYLFDHITMSPKQSIEKTKLQHCHDIKILFPFIDKDVTLDEFKNFKSKNKFIQPIAGNSYKNNLKGAIEYCTKSPEVKLSVQLHKILGVE